MSWIDNAVRILGYAARISFWASFIYISKALPRLESCVKFDFAQNGLVLESGLPQKKKKKKHPAHSLSRGCRSRNGADIREF